jgi:hypothetical protein
MADDSNIAADFIKAAEDTAAYRREQREAAARKQFGQLYDDFNRELSFIADAIASLSPTLGSTFRVHNPAANEYDRFAFTVDCDKPVRQGRITYTFSLWMDNKKITVDNEWRRDTGDNKYGQTSRTTPADFAEVRKKLAVWFGDVAPERVAELKNILFPEDRVTLKRNLQASSPIRLKPQDTTP